MQQGGFHGDTVCGNQPCQWPPSSTVTLKKTPEILTEDRTYLCPTSNEGGWEGQGSKFASETTKKILYDHKVDVDGD